MNESVIFLIQGPGRSIYFESFIFELKNLGYNVIVCSMCKAGPIQHYLKEKGFKCIEFETPRNPLFSFYKRHHTFWKKIAKEHGAKLIFPHLQWANFVALLIGKFNPDIKVIPTRHHIDASFLFNSKKRKIEDALINLFAKHQVVVSNHAREFMLRNEKFAKEKHISFIPLGYDFNLYEGLQQNNSQKIRSENPAKLLLLMAARMVTTKKHDLVLDAFKLLLDRKLDVKLMLLDDGPERDNIQSKIKSLSLENAVKIYGHQTNISDFMIAADLIIHPSIEESSNQIVKEAAYYNKTSIVTKGIGDFDEYILDKKNAFLINRESTPKELANLIEDIYNDKYQLNQMAQELRNVVISRFDIKNTVSKYLTLAALR